MSRFEKGTETQTGHYLYTYSYTENRQWILCPKCHKRLFEVIRGKDLIIEIKCRSCKEVMRIEK